MIVLVIGIVIFSILILVGFINTLYPSYGWAYVTGNQNSTYYWTYYYARRRYDQPDFS